MRGKVASQMLLHIQPEARLERNMNEKQRIEQATAEGFLLLFNQQFDTHYRIVGFGDAPDVRCNGLNGEELNLEITLTEDHPRDIQALLGRSSHKSLEALKEHNKRVAEGKEKPQFSSLSGNVLAQVAGRINQKLVKCYGPDTALIVRDTSGLDWDWELVLEELKEKTNSKRYPFDKGIWLLNLMMTKLYRVT